MKTLKFALLTLTALLIVLSVSVTLVLAQPNWFKKPLSRLVESQTGLQLSIGRLDSSIQPASFNIQQITLNNDAGVQLFTAEKVTVELLDWPTLSAPFFTLSVSAPHIVYQLDGNGNSNWPATKDQKQTAVEPSAFLLPGDFSFHSITIERGLFDIDLPAQKRKIALPTLKLTRDVKDNAKLQVVTEIDGERFELQGDFTLVSEKLLGINLGLVNPSVESILKASLSTRPQLNGTDGAIELSLHSTDFLSRLLGTPIPKIPGAVFSANFSIGERYQLSNLALLLGKQSLSGKADYSPLDNHLTIDLEAERLALDDLVAIFNESPNNPEKIEPGTATGEIASNRTLPEAAIDWIGLTGIELDADIRIGKFAGLGWTGEGLTTHAVVRNKGNKAPKIAIVASGKKIRNAEQNIDLDSLSLEADLAALALETSGADADINANITLNDKIKLKAKGRANLNGVSDQSLSLDFQAPESAELWRLAGLPYAEAGALNIRGLFESEQSTLKPELTLALGEQELDIELAYTPAANSSERSLVSITAKGRKLDTRFLTAADTAGTEEAAEQPKSPPENKTRLFSEDAIDTEFLRSFDADLSLDINKLVTHVNSIDRITMIAQLKDGRLTTRESLVTLPDNKITLSMSGDFRKDTSKTQIELMLDTKNAGTLGLEKAAQIKGGHGSIKVKLRGEGLSPHAIASSLNGSIDLRLQDMTMENNQLDLVGSDIVSEVVSKLNPFAKSDPITHLECVSVYFDANKGVFDSDKALHVETRKMKIIGNGQIDLGKETLSLNFTPIARKGLGVNLSYLVKLVKVYGDLQSPGIGVDAGGLVSSALSTGAAMATGGVSIVAQNLLERAMNAGSACNPDKKIELDIPQPVIEAAPEAIPEQAPPEPAVEPAARPSAPGK